ncbi:MAG TPA: hypothetical protein VFI23_10615 [Rhizomicrobium sp.]|nr:hypothetical protein [Rhizomicrobium sp.]
MSDERDPTRDAGALTRRTALVRSATGAAALACGLSGCATSSKIQGKMPQAEAQYQEHPSGLERCGVCKHFIPLTGCEIVAAPVQANGWCKYYALF